MTTRWPRVPLRTVVKFLSGGTPSKSVLEFWDGEIPWVSSGEMTQTYLEDTTLHISEQGLLDGSRLLPAKTVLIVVRGMSLAKEFRVAITQRSMAFNQDLKALVPVPELVAKFLFFFLRANANSIRDCATDASHGTKKLETRVLEEWPIPIPSSAEQQSIMDILSAYDDLIENNRRRIQLLEQAARLLYKEWFVHLRFPGHEHVKITNGVPEGWEAKRLVEITSKIGSGSTPRGGENAYQSSGITLIRSMNVYDYRFDDQGLAYIDESQAERLAAVTVEAGDVLLNITGAYVGRCCIVPSRHLPARVNQHVMIIRPNRQMCSPMFVLHAINSHETKQGLLNVARAGGATREALTKDVVSGTTIKIPPMHLIQYFDLVVGGVFQQQEVLAMQNVRLSKARDLLLPRLMNGEIPV